MLVRGGPHGPWPTAHGPRPTGDGRQSRNATRDQSSVVFSRLHSSVVFTLQASSLFSGLQWFSVVVVFGSSSSSSLQSSVFRVQRCVYVTTVTYMVMDDGILTILGVA